jgi:hypothetical protein
MKKQYLCLTLLLCPIKAQVEPFPTYVTSMIRDHHHHGNCVITGSWRKALGEIFHYSQLYSKTGCKSEKNDQTTTANSANSGPPLSLGLKYVLDGEDTGYDDHIQMLQNFTEFESCANVARSIAYGKSMELNKHISGGHHEDHSSSLEQIVSPPPAVETRQVLFAAMGCLHNRNVWAQVRDENIAPNIAIFSDCAIGRFFREGVDISIPTLPYPDL